MAEPQTRGEVRALLERHGLRPRKSLGQHFLVDPNIVAKIVRLAGVGLGDRVVEIGAGTGTLTLALAGTGAEVLAYEIDEGLRPVLEEVLAPTSVRLRFADAARVDLAGDLAALGGDPWAMVANLPYNVGTSIVLDALRRVPAITRFVVMVQSEVADRLAAPPGGDAYGLPSVVVGLHAKVGERFTVPPQVFLPPPRVGSTVVVLDRVAAPPGAEAAIALAAAGFGQRRKMLRSSLGKALADPVAACTTAEIDPGSRAQDLTPAEWLRLAGAA